MGKRGNVKVHWECCTGFNSTKRTRLNSVHIWKYYKILKIADCKKRNETFLSTQFRELNSLLLHYLRSFYNFSFLKSDLLPCGSWTLTVNTDGNFELYEHLSVYYDSCHCASITDLRTECKLRSAACRSRLNENKCRAARLLLTL